MAEMPVVLIPSLEPKDGLISYVKEMMDSGFDRIVVVDDGSGPAYRAIFDSLEQLGCTVLHHLVNRGKGDALKTGYDWIGEHCSDRIGVLTADSDGQHRTADCRRVAEALASGDNALWLGSRDFNLPDVPPKSRFGNRTTSRVFQLLYGQYLPDTQTGLRAFRMEELPFMAGVAGDRYEYEMNVLIASARRKLPIRTLTIETVYENNNEGTHFHPIRDSWRIYKVILGSFLKFIASSLFCFTIDQLLANLLQDWLQNVFISGYGARVVSSTLNYLINRNVVFKEKGSAGQSAWRYAVLCVGVITASNVLVKLLTSIGMVYWLAKMLVDSMLYFVNYFVQKGWVFAERKDRA